MVGKQISASLLFILIIFAGCAGETKVEKEISEDEIQSIEGAGEGFDVEEVSDTEIDEIASGIEEESGNIPIEDKMADNINMMVEEIEKKELSEIEALLMDMSESEAEIDLELDFE